MVLTETGTPAVNDDGEMTEIGGVVDVEELVVPPETAIGMLVDDKLVTGDDGSGRPVGDGVSSGNVYSVGSEI